MKKTGRGQSYEKALLRNLVRSLTVHKKITTTVARGQRLKAFMIQDTDVVIKTTRIGNRPGDNARLMEVELVAQTKKHDNKANKAKGRAKSVASD